MNRLPDRQKLYQIAESQAGYFTTRQASAAGYSYALLTHYVRTGKFLRIKRGLYRLAEFPEMPFADLFIAWLSAGERAIISHDSALALYDLSDHLPAEIHLTVPRTASRRLTGVRLHTARLVQDEVTQRQGLPVTTVARTIADLILSGLSEELVAQAILQALERGMVSEVSLQEYARRRGGNVERTFLRVLGRIT